MRTSYWYPLTILHERRLLWMFLSLDVKILTFWPICAKSRVFAQGVKVKKDSLGEKLSEWIFALVGKQGFKSLGTTNVVANMCATKGTYTCTYSHVMWNGPQPCSNLFLGRKTMLTKNLYLGFYKFLSPDYVFIVLIVGHAKICHESCYKWYYIVHFITTSNYGQLE